MTTAPLTQTRSASSFFGLSDPQTGVVDGTPKLLLRLEGLALFAAAIGGYRGCGGGWGFFAALLLAPDLSMLGYLAGPKVGAAVYNLAHAMPLPSVLAGISIVTGATGTPLLVALIWLAHIGMDRAAGYGLKYGSSFFDTHLGRVGGR